MNTHDETLLNFISIEIGYNFICKKNLWRFALNVEMKRGHVQVKLGKRVHVEL